MTEFLLLKSADEARQILRGFGSVGVETVGIERAAGRVLAEAAFAPEDLPAFARATMDGYAVRSRDVFGASDGAPAYLRIGPTIAMGAPPPRPLAAGEALPISTGGMLPEGADAVVMVEWTAAVGAEELEVLRAVAPGANVIRAGEDVPRGREVLPPGRRLRPQDVALLAALGLVRVPVQAVPLVRILSTGNEIVPPERAPAPGQVRDANQLALAAAAARAGARVETRGIVIDDLEALRRAAREAAEGADLLLLSGGSSVGVRDLTARVLGELGTILFHGISVRPGRPTLLSQGGGRPLVGMPGPPTSALVIFEVFIRPLVHALGGEVVADLWPARVRARLLRRQASVPGREDWIRVRLGSAADGSRTAEPLLGGSAALSNLVASDGYLRIEAGCEGVAEGEEIEVLLHA